MINESPLAKVVIGKLNVVITAIMPTDNVIREPIIGIYDNMLFVRLLKVLLEKRLKNSL